MTADDAAAAGDGVAAAVDSPMCHDSIVEMVLAALADEDCFVVMTVVGYYDCSDSLRNSVHDHSYRNQIRLCVCVVIHFYDSSHK